MGKTVIVTGASKGLGLAIAKYLLSKSHNVVLLARTEGPLRQLAEEHPEQVRYLAGDLTDDSFGQKSVDLAISVFGGLHGLIVNHGALGGVDKLADCKLDEWRWMLDLNFFSALAFVKAAIPLLRKTKGAVIFTSSGASTSAYQAWGAYSVSKAGQNALARQIACEEPDISAYAIRPGQLDTDMQREIRDGHVAKMAEADAKKFVDAFKNGKLVQPEKPAEVMARLVIDPIRSLNGQYVNWESDDLAMYRSESQR